MWWPLMQSLKAFLASDLNPAGTPPESTVTIAYGDGAMVETFPSVWLIRESEKASLHPGKDGLVTLNIQCWVSNESPTAATRYARLYDLEYRVNDAIRRWQRTTAGDPVVRAVVKANITGTVFANNSRPACGSRTIVDFKWEKAIF